MSAYEFASYVVIAGLGVAGVALVGFVALIAGSAARGTVRQLRERG